MFVSCVMVSYPLQFYVPMERIEKYIIRKCPVERHVKYIYAARFFIVIATLTIAEIVPHLALFIALIGAVACTSLALLFPPIIDLLVCYAQNRLTLRTWIIDGIMLVFAFIGFTTGTYAALSDIIATFQWNLSKIVFRVKNNRNCDTILNCAYCSFENKQTFLRSNIA